MKFFIDNNLAPSLAHALNELSKPDRHEVWHLRDRFRQSTPDHEWIGRLAKEGGWIIVTQDRLRKNFLEKQALRDSRLTAFFLKKGWSEQKHWEKAWKLVRWWPAIVDQAERIEPGAAFLVPIQLTGKGKFEQFNY